MEDPSTRRSVLQRITVLAACAAPIGVGALAVAESRDADLIQLGQQLDALWEQERSLVNELSGDRSPEAEQALSAAVGRTSAVVSKIEAIPAVTVAGLVVKATATSWCHCGDEVEFGNEDPATDARLASSIIRDLLAMKPA